MPLPCPPLPSAGAGLARHAAVRPVVPAPPQPRRPQHDRIDDALASRLSRRGRAMSRALWFVAGAATSAYALVKARRAAEARTPEGGADEHTAEHPSPMRNTYAVFCFINTHK